MLYRSFLLFCTLCVPLFPTTLVALWTPEKLLIGADSKIVMTEGAGAASACKILHEGSTFFALSGLVRDMSSDLNVSALAREVARKGGPISSKVDRFVEALRPKLIGAVEGLKVDARTD